MDEWHVTIGALRRLLRIIEGACPFTRDARRLPVVVVVEAAEPAIRIDRHVEMNFVTARTEFGRLFAMKRLQENLLVRLWIDVGQLIVGEPQEWMIARGKVVKRRVLNLEIPLSHRASDVGD